VTTLEHLPIKVIHHRPFSLSLFPRPPARGAGCEVGCWRDRGMDEKPIWSAPSPNFGDIYIMPAVMCANLQPSRRFLNLIDGSNLPGCLQQPLASRLAQTATSMTSRQLPFLLQRQERDMCCVRPPATPTCLASIPGDNTDHSRIDVPRLAFSIARLPV